jgi:hypothetical protein
MSVVKEGIRISEDGKINFGDYGADAKVKAKAELSGDEYSVKTHRDVTRLEKNGALLLEAVPGAAAADFVFDEDGVTFDIYGNGNTQITLELFPETEYELKINDSSHGKFKTNKSGKLSFGEELSGKPVSVSVKK